MEKRCMPWAMNWILPLLITGITETEKVVIHLDKLFERISPLIFINNQRLHLCREEGSLKDRQQQQRVWKVLIGQDEACSGHCLVQLCGGVVLFDEYRIIVIAVLCHELTVLGCE